MDFDIKKTINLVKGGLLAHETTWSEYLAGNPTWQQTATVLTGPLLVANVVLGLIFSRMLGGYATYGYHGGFVAALVIGLVFAAIGFFIAVFVFNYLAAVFKGKSDFARAFAAVSLAAIPAWLAGIVGALLPMIGFLVALAGGIVSLVFLYKIMPLALGVPAEKRVVHFVVSLIAIFIVNMVIAMVLGAGTMSGQMGQEGLLGQNSGPVTYGSGMLGDMERQGRLMEEAAADTYDPPGDGKLDEDQVEAFVAVMRKAEAAGAQYSEKMDALAKSMEEKEKAGEEPSVSDLGKLYAGVGTVLGANNAEMEVVKTGGGNWAEHQWVKEQLRTARLHQGEGSDAIAHNYELYQEYAEELGDLL